jgi:hypothetical protein
MPAYLEVTMRPLVVLFAIGALACGSSPGAPNVPVDPEAAPANPAAGCFGVQLTGEPAADVSLPGFIELSLDPAPGFVNPGRLAVREPKAVTPRAPISWWIPTGKAEIELVLGGGFTGYNFLLRPAERGSWTGQGTYFADFGVEPAPGPLIARLTPAACP